MIRRIIKIDEKKCDGCGLCASACHEGAIGIVNGKAVLLREDYCDGLGDCLPSCPMHAITFEEREALAYDEAAVFKLKKEISLNSHPCPGSSCRNIQPVKAKRQEDTKEEEYVKEQMDISSQLTNFPVQIKLLPLNAPYFENADLLIAADCTAYAYGNFHHEFMKNHVTMIGCPKLDAVDYAEKLTQILKYNNIRTITVVRMTVPCCGGLSRAVQTAVENSGKNIPLQIITISPDGQMKKQEEK